MHGPLVKLQPVAHLLGDGYAGFAREAFEIRLHHARRQRFTWRGGDLVNEVSNVLRDRHAFSVTNRVLASHILSRTRGTEAVWLACHIRKQRKSLGHWICGGSARFDEVAMQPA